MTKRLLTTITALTVAAGLTAAPASAADTASTRPRCDEGHWPATVQGRPRTFHAGGRTGFYVWHDTAGWHLRTTTPAPGHHTFSGVIRSDDDVKVVKTYRDEANDVVRTKGHTIAFRFDTHDHVDGIDLVVGCTDKVTFSLKGPGRTWVGRTGTVTQNPFTVHRVDS